MSGTSLAAAHRLLAEGVEQLCAAGGASASEEELLAVLTLCEGIGRQLDRVSVEALAVLDQRRTFAWHGYRNPAAALGDLLGWERFEGRRHVIVAESVSERVGLDGVVSPPRLPATAAAFTEGRAGLRHVEAIANVLASPAAGRLDPEVWGGAEEQLAAQAAVYTPAELLAFGTALVEALDQDGAAPDDLPPASVNELHLRRHRGRPGGRISGRFDDAALFDPIAALLDAKAAPRSADDDRTSPQRHAEALSEVCAHVLDHGPAGVVPDSGGRRPQLNVIVRLEDLEQRARAGVLDFGGTLTPESLRMLACDAAVIPLVMNGAGQPLDIGRATRTVPDGLRRAVAVRDRGCAHPGCDRPPSWCQVHHVIPWEHGGETSLGNTVMVCRMHHRLLHRSEWVVRLRDGLPEFVPPRWIDPEQRPRRKPLPHLIGA